MIKTDELIGKHYSEVNYKTWCFYELDFKGELFNLGEMYCSEHPRNKGELYFDENKNVIVAVVPIIDWAPPICSISNTKNPTDLKRKFGPPLKSGEKSFFDNDYPFLEFLYKGFIVHITISENRVRETILYKKDLSID